MQCVLASTLMCMRQLAYACKPGVTSVEAHWPEILRSQIYSPTKYTGFLKSNELFYSEMQPLLKPLTV